MRERLLRPMALVLALGACGERLAPRPELVVDPLPASTDQVVLPVTGSATAGARVRIEGGAAPAAAIADEAGRFRALVPLRVGGRNRLVVYPSTAMGEGLGRELTVEQRVVEHILPAADFVPPPRPLLDPVAPAVASTVLAIRGTAEPGAAVVIRDPYQIQRIAAAIPSGRFEAIVRLRRAAISSVLATAEDAAGNRSEEAVVNVRHDPSLISPSADPLSRPVLDALPADTGATRVTVTGRAARYAQVRIDGGETPAQGVSGADGVFAVGVALRTGTANELAVRTVDDLGRESEPAVVGLLQRLEARGTRYPLVFAHGAGGAERILGVLPYWWGVKEALEAQGYEVLMDDVSPLNSVAHRAAQLRGQIDRYTSGKVNIIGHSMGGLDARYLVSRLGFAERVASVTSLSTPHHGTPIADLALGAVGRDAFVAADFLFRLAGYSLAAVRELSVEGMRDFNPGTPDHPRVRYFSFGGKADPLGRTGNILAPYFVATWGVIAAIEGDNDGLVSVTSSRWGEYLGTLPADHLDEVGQFFGIADHFDHLEFYRELAAGLRAQGL